MRLIWLPFASLMIGAVIGSVFTFTIPVVYAKYLSIAILAAVDSVFGGIRGIVEDTFDGYIMLTGFFTNALLAAGLAFLGDKIGVDMYLAATVCFGLRLFSNLGYIRRFFINKLYDYMEQKKNKTIPNNTEQNMIHSIIDDVTGSISPLPTETNTSQQSTPQRHHRQHTDEYIQEFMDADIKEYTKMKDRKQNRKP